MNDWTKAEAIDLMGDMVLALMAIALLASFALYVGAVAWGLKHGKIFGSRRGSGTASSPRR